MGSNLPLCEPTRQNVDDLLALVENIRKLAYDRHSTPADALIDIRGLIREARGEFRDQE
jgi:hypothetical protein